jgi:hypothetical protein
MTDYDLAHYLLASLPPDERQQTVDSLRRASIAEFLRMLEPVKRDSLESASRVVSRL